MLPKTEEIEWARERRTGAAVLLESDRVVLIDDRYWPADAIVFYPALSASRLTGRLRYRRGEIHIRNWSGRRTRFETEHVWLSVTQVWVLPIAWDQFVKVAQRIKVAAIGLDLRPSSTQSESLAGNGACNVQSILQIEHKMCNNSKGNIQGRETTCD